MMVLTFGNTAELCESKFDEKVKGRISKQVYDDMKYIFDGLEFNPSKKNSVIIDRTAAAVQEINRAVSKYSMVNLYYPETGLHPQELIRFTDVAMRSKGMICIVTQSELMLLRAQQAIRYGRYSNKDVIIEYASKDDFGVDIQLDDEGDIIDIKKLDKYGGFFEEGFNLQFTDKY